MQIWIMTPPRMFSLVFLCECICLGSNPAILKGIASSCANAGMGKLTLSPLFIQAKPQLSLQSEAFCASLLQIYLGPKSVIPEAKKAWLANAVRG